MKLNDENNNEISFEIKKKKRKHISKDEFINKGFNSKNNKEIELYKAIEKNKSILKKENVL